jgi:hypothetical protein
VLRNFIALKIHRLGRVWTTAPPSQPPLDSVIYSKHKIFSRSTIVHNLILYQPGNET